MTGFRGHNQAAGRSGPKGPVPQKELVSLLSALIDASQARAASRTRDEARKALRELLAISNWQTPYVRRNIGVKRCRYLAGLGYAIPEADLVRSSIDRLEAWVERNG